MRFRIRQRPRHNIPHFDPADFDLAKRFSEAVHKEMGDFLKAVIFFGSGARQTQVAASIAEHDIDVLLVINDLTIVVTPEVVEAYRIIVQQTAGQISRRLHINTMKITQLWEYSRMGDPLIVNILRDGIPLLDKGFFEPLQYLLHQGRIRPTKESVWVYYARAPATLTNSQYHLLQACVDLYWAVIDAAHAALMHLGIVPGAPDQIAQLIDEHLVARKLVPRKYAHTMHFFYELSKKITRREIPRVSGKEFDHYYEIAHDFVRRMEDIIRNRPGAVR